MKLGKLTLSGLSFLAFAVAAGAGYEAYQHLRYESWRRDFDSGGWLGKATVPSENPTLLWEYRPYGRRYSIEMNRFGFRERDTVQELPPPEIVRIAFIGDSVTLGLKVEEEEAFVRQYEGLVGEGVEALNFGVDGYDATQVRELLRTRVLPFHPQVVLYTICLNDFDSRHSSYLKSLYFRKPRWFLGLKLEEAYRKLLGADFHAFYFAKNHRRVFDEILTMKRLVEEAGGELLVAVLPVFYETWSHEGYPLHPVHGEIQAFLRQSSIPSLDLLGDLAAEEALPADLSEDLWHPNVLGHRRIAEALTRWPELTVAISRKGLPTGEAPPAAAATFRQPPEESRLLEED